MNATYNTLLSENCCELNFRYNRFTNVLDFVLQSIFPNEFYNLNFKNVYQFIDINVVLEKNPLIVSLFIWIVILQKPSSSLYNSNFFLKCRLIIHNHNQLFKSFIQLMVTLPLLFQFFSCFVAFMKNKGKLKSLDSKIKGVICWQK